ncbi:hypothetical protein HK405_012440, partial [Cladochytrium tenue]
MFRLRTAMPSSRVQPLRVIAFFCTFFLLAATAATASLGRVDAARVSAAAWVPASVGAVAPSGAYGDGVVVLGKIAYAPQQVAGSQLRLWRRRPNKADASARRLTRRSP